VWGKFGGCEGEKIPRGVSGLSQQKKKKKRRRKEKGIEEDYGNRNTKNRKCWSPGKDGGNVHPRLNEKKSAKGKTVRSRRMKKKNEVRLGLRIEKLPGKKTERGNQKRRVEKEENDEQVHKPLKVRRGLWKAKGEAEVLGLSMKKKNKNPTRPGGEEETPPNIKREEKEKTERKQPAPNLGRRERKEFVQQRTGWM